MLPRSIKCLPASLLFPLGRSETWCLHQNYKIVLMNNRESQFFSSFVQAGEGPKNPPHGRSPTMQRPDTHPTETPGANPGTAETTNPSINPSTAGLADHQLEPHEPPASTQSANSNLRLRHSNLNGPAQAERDEEGREKTQQRAAKPRLEVVGFKVQPNHGCFPDCILIY